MKTYKQGDKVKVNGNNEARIIRQYDGNMYEVRLWDGFRHVGDICVDKADIHENERLKNLETR